MNKVTVVTACFNSALVIKKNIESVNNQVGVDVEHIFIDGGSTDSTLELIHHNSSNLGLVVTGKDDGIYNALNIGISEASGEIICILNSDDFFENDSVLSNITKVFDVEDTDIVYSGIRYVDSNYKTVAVWMPNQFEVGSFITTWHPPHPGFFARKSCYDRAGLFDLNFVVAADFELMYRFMEVYGFKSTLFANITVCMRNDGYSSRFQSRLLGLNDIRNTFIKHNKPISLSLLLLKRYMRKVRRVFKYNFEEWRQNN